ncbi:TlpA disulfide reductase family protein [Microbacterium sp. NPDC086615]|uniref:TlpA family protein disulfide reductase n=1 Tax=Microbacterium sp. NPDC086615 TaxID=3154865 RepID=UPI003411FBD3
MRRILSAAVVAVLAVSLAACTTDPLAEQYRSGDNKGYIAGDFQTQEIAPDRRGEPVDFAGTLDNGSPVSSDDFAGKVLVVNFWYATCGPCIIEAPRLEQAYQSFQGQDVAFLGINTYDQGPTALSFARDNKVSYSSALAVNDAELKLAFNDKTPLNATPTTLVLDKQGRVAARIIGELPEASILESMVRTVLEENA